MDICHHCCSKFTVKIVQILFCIITVFAAALGFSYIIKVFVWFGTKKWEFTLWTIHVSLIPSIGDLIIGGGTIAAFALIMCIMILFEKLLCPVERRYNEQLKDYIINEIINNNNNNNSVTTPRQHSPDGGETHNYPTNKTSDKYIEIELDTISTTFAGENDDKTIKLLSSSTSSVLFSSEGDDNKNEESSSFDTFLNDIDYTTNTTINDKNDTKKIKKNTHIAIQKHVKTTK